MAAYGISLNSTLAAATGGMANSQLLGQIAMRVLKQVEDQQLQQAQAIVEMGRVEPVKSDTGSNVDFYA